MTHNDLQGALANLREAAQAADRAYEFWLLTHPETAYFDRIETVAYGAHVDGPKPYNNTEGPFGFHSLAQVYRDAARQAGLLDLSNNYEREMGIAPIGFLYRQAIELELKAVLLLTWGAYGIDQKTHVMDKHDLRLLLAEVGQVLREGGVATKQDPRWEALVDSVGRLADVDAKSMAFRYTCLKNGADIFDNTIRINTSELMGNMEVMLDFLYGIYQEEMVKMSLRNEEREASGYNAPSPDGEPGGEEDSF